MHIQDEHPDLAFDVLMEGIDLSRGFDHRAHIELTWSAIHHHGITESRELINAGLNRLATSANVPQKFHITITEAWFQLISQAIAEDDSRVFSVFAGAHPELLDPYLLNRFYKQETLGSEKARTSWLEPDLAPLKLGD